MITLQNLWLPEIVGFLWEICEIFVRYLWDNCEISVRFQSHEADEEAVHKNFTYFLKMHLWRQYWTWGVKYGRTSTFDAVCQIFDVCHQIIDVRHQNLTFGVNYWCLQWNFCNQKWTFWFQKSIFYIWSRHGQWLNFGPMSIILKSQCQ